MTPPADKHERQRLAFNESYRPALRRGVIWVFILALWCSLVSDMGESMYTFIYSLGGYVLLMLLVMLRRPATPTALDLFLVAWALPLIFFAGAALFPIVSRLAIGT